MWRYVLKRLLAMIPMLFGAAVLTFVLMRLIPGDICYMRLAAGGGSVSAAVLDGCRVQLGRDQPVWRQFLEYVWGLVRFDFGLSMWTGRPIVQEITLRFELSLQVAIMATLTAIALAIPMGVISAVKQNLATTKSWLGHPWMPPIKFVPLWEDPWQNLSMLIWPALATGYRYSAVATRMTRSALLEVLREDYVRTARAKGLIEKIVINRHALRNALLPVITVIGIEFAFLMGGLVVTEQVFNLNGLGKLFVESVQNYDYNMTQALVMLTVFVFAISNFAVDLAYGWLDPRIRYD